MSGHHWTQPTSADMRGEQHLSQGDNVTKLTSLHSLKFNLQMSAPRKKTAVDVCILIEEN